jgi:tetratricopeptide (TPR) repeat protein
MKKKSPVTHFRLGQMYMIKKDYIRARLEFKKTITLDPEMVEAYKKLADSCMVLGDFNEALESYEKAYSKYKDDLELAMSLAICYDNNSRVADAITVLNEIKEKQPDFTMVNYNLAYGYNTLKKYDEALIAIKDEIKYFPDNEMAFDMKESVEKSIKEGK